MSYFRTWSSYFDRRKHRPHRRGPNLLLECLEDRCVMDAVPDLAFTSASGPTSVMVGNQAQVNFAIVNQGLAAATGAWTYAVYLSQNGVLDAADTLLLQETRPAGSSLGVDETLTVQRTVTIPRDAVPGA